MQTLLKYRNRETVTEEAGHGAKSATLNLPTPDAETADFSLLPVNKDTFIFKAKRET